MKNFFQNDQYTEFFNPETNEVWVFGDTPENITKETPHQYVGKDPSWGDGSEEEMELPVTDGHGIREMQKGRVYVGEKFELIGTAAENNVAKFYNFNAE